MRQYLSIALAFASLSTVEVTFAADPIIGDCTKSPATHFPDSSSKKEDLNRVSAHLLALDEPNLRDLEGESIRITVVGYDESPVSVRLVRKSDGVQLVGKIYDGEGGICPDADVYKDVAPRFPLVVQTINAPDSAWSDIYPLAQETIDVPPLDYNASCQRRLNRTKWVIEIIDKEGYRYALRDGCSLSEERAPIDIMCKLLLEAMPLSTAPSQNFCRYAAS